MGLALAGLLYWTSRTLPALTELLRPGYWLIAIALAVFTIRWVRPRAHDRRTRERRRDERRTESPPDSP